MSNLSQFKKELFLLSLGLFLAGIALFNYLNPQLTEILGSERPAMTPTPTPDPAKDLNSLDNSLSYTLPALWKKSDHIDPAGDDTYIKITSPDFNSPEASQVQNGVGLIIDRTYDLKAEVSLKAKLDTVYDFDTYNITPIKLNGKNGMTMHQDKNGHHRLIYIATQTHLWEITITSKSLEDEQKYQGDINTFLNSIKFN